MATDLQRDLAEAIVKNQKLPIRERKNKGELLESVGYNTSTAKKKPTEIMEQKGVKEVLAEYGLTEGLVTRSLVSDIKEKPKNRVSELRLAAEILKMNEKDKGEGNKTLILFVSGESAQRFNVSVTSNPENSSS